MSLTALKQIPKLAIPSNLLPFKVMILAAGRGERMRPLTDLLPKPLLRVGNQSLIEYHLRNLARAGFVEIVINHAYLGEMIESALGNGERYGINIHYSPESLVLETAGGIANALPLLTDGWINQPFLTINADIYCDLDFAKLVPVLQYMQSNPEKCLVHLVLVDNPGHHMEGDFALDIGSGQILLAGRKKLTFSGIGVYQPWFFNNVKPNTAVKLAPLLREAIEMKKISGEYFGGMWFDVGTPERLSQLDAQLTSQL